MLLDLAPALGLPAATLRTTLGRYGNTGATSMPVTLDAAHREGLLAPGDRVLFAAFGGGMNLAASLCTRTGLPAPSGSSARMPESSGRGFSE
ncbi:hypothetical protein OG244_09105 [Streptomyces brevispora]|uniref:3-oxoacyl-[acyl-carrier-protein] synthase III C-terminal domain-containing protein n=1 Tax=Streptomyces brevispora TaxID=887462 RepID=UPI002E2ECE3F|nr:3-oxoacyl-[acyl-carrier-protein] synthase III C-terminal domain-containing protein [Streptomyces brevispora]